MHYNLKIDIINYIAVKVLLKRLNKKQITNVLKHINKTHFLIKFFLNLSSYLINFYSLLFYYNFFDKKNEKDRFLILSKIQKIKILKQDKLFEFFHALLILHTDFYEKEKKIKINKKNIFKMSHVENIIIGSGPSGAITAFELLKKNKKTLIIEKGDFIGEFKLKHPGQEFLNMWENGGISASLGNAQIKYASAECFGGGSEINSGLYHLPDKNLISHLKKKFKINNLSQAQLINNLDELNKNIKISKSITKHDKISNILLRFSRKLKYKCEILPRLMSHSYTKSSMTNTILSTYLKKGGNISLRSEVINIKKENNLWKLIYKKDKKSHSVTCENLFICAGTINTLSLLINNKIISPKKIQNFHFHPMLKVVAKFPKKVNSKFFNISPVQINNFFPKYIMGVAASSRSQLKINCYNNKTMYANVKKNWENMIIFHVTFSLGTGKVLTLSKEKDPIIIYNISKRENLMLNEGLNTLSNFLFSIGADYIYPANDLNKIILKNDNFKKQYISKPKKFNLSSVHILGGCPFGEDKKKTFLDSFGKLHNFSGLYVNDGSLICGHLIKNPQGTIMSLALRNVKNFLLKNK